MRSFFRLCLFAILATIFVFPSHAMLMTGNTMVSPDKTRFIALLGHHHKRTGIDHEERQLIDLVAICKQGVQEGKKFHILYERSGDMPQFFRSEKNILGDIEEFFAEAQVPDCIIENIEMRDFSNAAYHIFSHNGDVRNEQATWNYGSKAFGELEFQDLFDEFEEYASELEPFAQRVVQENANCPEAPHVVRRYTLARNSLNKIKSFLRENELGYDTNILSLARERVADCRGLALTTRRAFSDLFDLHIFRRLMQLDPTAQAVVIAGSWHTMEVAQLLSTLTWRSGLIKGFIFDEIPIPLTYRNLRSIVLNETEWTQIAKDMAKYLINFQMALGARLEAISALIP